MRRKFKNSRGQALIMVTLALFAMIGLMGLAVDVGWAVLLEKQLQSATDSAALAAIREAMYLASSLADYNCGGTAATCAETPIDCASASGNLQVGCDYAIQNGFDWTDSRTSVRIQASDRLTPPTVAAAPGACAAGQAVTIYHPPTAPCVDTYYWVTVRAARTVPQLFSSIFGNETGLVSARSTAAVAQSTVAGSLILLNRDDDPWTEDPGTNLHNGGGPDVYVPGGIIMASGDSEDAGFLSGNPTVEAPYTWIRDDGDVYLQGAAVWNLPPENEFSGGEFPPEVFLDPFLNDGQPQLGDYSSLIARDVPEGAITEAICPEGTCLPGIYYATEEDPNCTQATCDWIPSGEPISIWQGDYSFGNTNFNEFVFFGGLNIGQAEVNFAPGRYVLAGVEEHGSLVFETTNKSFITGGDPSSLDPGRIFILTDDQYASDQLAAARNQVNANHADNPLPDLFFGGANMIAGNNVESSITLQGLNRNSSEIQDNYTELVEFSPVLLWQDQRNSNYAYTSGGDYACEEINDACLYSGDDFRGPVSPELHLQATPFMDLWGAIYQPRGAWSVIQAAGIDTGPLMIITGALRMQGTGQLTFTGPETPVVNFVTALVE